MVLAISFYEGIYIYILTAIVAGVFAALGYLFKFPEDKYFNWMNEAEEEFWGDICTEYGDLVADFYNDIENDANYYTSDLSNPNEAADIAYDFFGDHTVFEQLNKSIDKINEPIQAYQRCRTGARYAPWMFILSAIIPIPLLFVGDQILYILLLAVSFSIFLLGIFLSIKFLRNRRKIDRIHDSQNFMAE